MAQKYRYILKSITLDEHFSTTSELFFRGERAMNNWLDHTPEGQWCDKNIAFKDITFRINYRYAGVGEYPVVQVMGELDENEYTMFCLHKKGK